MLKFGKRRCSALFAAALGLLLAVPQTAVAVPGGNISISWSIPGAPDTGMTGITFPMTISPETAHKRGTYFAQQFSFQGGMGGYTGLQPRENKHGKERLNGIFSIFGKGASTSDPNCTVGADGGAGVSCGYEFDAVYGHTYHLTVKRTGADVWTGTARDTTTGTTVRIGTYTLPAGSGNLKASHGGFVEYYYGVPSCSAMPRTDAVFGGPTTTAANGLSGTSRANYEYGACVGKSNYRAEQTGNGTHVSRGSISVSPSTSLVSQASGRCLNADGSEFGDRVNIWDCGGSNSQMWAVTDQGKIVSDFGCLDAAADTAPGTKLTTGKCDGRRSRQWKANSDGTITGAGSGLCVDVTGGGRTNGTPVELQICDGSTSQKWSLRK